MTARVGVIILAAGRGSRFDRGGRAAKVLAPLHGIPLVRIVAQIALASRAATVTAVTGPTHVEIAEALQGLRVQIVRNADFASGLASSLQTGLRRVMTETDGVLVMLADMPCVQSSTLDLLLARFDCAPDTIDAVVPVYEGRRGNPVLIGRRLFARVGHLRGDEGARRLLLAPDLVIERCKVADSGVTIDIDTVAKLADVQLGRISAPASKTSVR